MSYYRWQNDDLILQLHLQPKAKTDDFCGLHGESLKVRIKAPPVDGKANAYLTKFMAKAFGVSKSKVVIESGELSREKRVRIISPVKIPEGLSKELAIQEAD
ncbi:YggU family protein [Endozoicomonas sp. OPT23]|uniref:DUF167 domain-containing protein n=1 Tax=Endozoicomonas sp. OPT23 TaxID=2072845 RepID=UPI00129A21F3|nr:DUF167 domain-containing protein [Endozoicomonas sp. OPT23]MRI32575.1 YggU family protein [Endozoicomonas sp. OPT23]